MDGETVVSVAERLGLEPKTYRLMLMETIERREGEMQHLGKRRSEVQDELNWYDGRMSEVMEEIMKLKNKLVKEYMAAGEKL